MTRVISAAGGVVFRKTSNGNLRLLVAHRPSYDDWSFPKGKAEPGETAEETAIREVLEETGFHCRIVTPIGTTRYRVTGGIKEVSWFAMRPLPDSPGFKKNREVDQVKWLSRSKAVKTLDYQFDRNLIEETDIKKLSQTGVLRLLRHGNAGNREKWSGIDSERPLTKSGKRQAKAIADSLLTAGIEKVVTSPYRRCVQTVEPLAAAIGAEIEISDALAEEADIDKSYLLADSLIGANAVLCSHGDVIPALVNRMMWAGLALSSRFFCAKASIWEVSVDGGKFTTGQYVPSPDV